eukprot:7988507-Pyramimonas_sp.AAC.1
MLHYIPEPGWGYAKRLAEEEKRGEEDKLGAQGSHLMSYPSIPPSPYQCADLLSIRTARCGHGRESRRIRTLYTMHR